jgi:site-specific DNA-cytosine methylase
VLTCFHPMQDPISSEDGLTHALGTGSSGGCASAAVAFTKSKRAQSVTDDESRVPGDVSPTMSCFDQGDTRATTVVAFKPKYYTRDNAKMEGAPSCCGTVGTLLTNDTGDNAPAVATPMAVRRLTPRECERLQGFPDDYTLVTYRGKPACDGPRYRALGNSMAVPVMRWIGERIRMVDT